MEDKEASNSKETQTKKARRVCHYNVDWKLRFVWLNKCDEDNRKGYCKLCKNSFTVAYDGLKAVTHHAEAKEHKECESAAAMSHRMKSFFTPKGSAQSEKVGIAELTEVYHGIKRHISYVPQDCSLKVLKQVIRDSDIVKQMTGGRTKCTALLLFNFYEDSFEDSTSIKERLCEVMNKSRLPWSRVTAYGADNASVNFGVNNSVFQKLKSEENDIIAAHYHEVKKFTKNATNAYHRALAYIEKWYPFENQYYKTFSCLNLECGRLPTLDQLLELWSTWKQQTPPEQIYDELAGLQSVFPSLTLEATRGLLATDHVILNHVQVTRTTLELAPILLTTIPHQREDISALDRFNVHRSPTRRVFGGTGLKLMTYLPWSDTLTTGLPQPRIFSVMGNVWTDERNSLAVNTVKSELCIFFNISSSCTEFKDAISTNKPLLKAVSSNAKYTK
ncbi:uncharacterized protein TNCV_4142821 [Trichonephila clavipes]|nr:uncharacterized protein TNCV_4142821 [Trichonephila clavipes]